MKSIQPGLVSVIIPAYNGQAYIRAAIESALAQSYRPIEILVVDDGSPTDMQPFTQGYGPEVKYIRQANGGTAAARNTGWRASQGEYIALLDQDDLWLPGKLEKQIPIFQDRTVGLVAGWMEVFESTSGEPRGLYQPPAEMTVHDMLGHELPPVQTMIFRRAALDRIGGFDETMKGTDDWDINIRVAAAYRVICVQEVLGRARMHDTQQGGNGDQMYQNSLRVLNKHSVIHPGCAECRAALRKSRKLVRQYHSFFVKSRAGAAWREGRYTAALTRAARAVWQNPPLLTQAVGRALKGH